ncbi:uncharacterized protein LOC128840760 isoform X1 [Malaclemys terrapin pileata]|uniref:uncharacterized protein LOC128840760 isoform X1 n=1 Tax=Malaclemys terrapin pileata TaxID=2991368 RepID=UPI0023A82D1A|nr:uncharacterized protein LOC128840760 isoform X1 [Malaclemys terrapin pileata]
MSGLPPHAERPADRAAGWMVPLTWGSDSQREPLLRLPCSRDHSPPCIRRSHSAVWSSSPTAAQPARRNGSGLSKLTPKALPQGFWAVHPYSLLHAAANSSSLPPPSRRLSQIRRRKKRTRDEMFSEIMESSRSDRAHLNEWKETVSKYRKEASEREDRRDQREDRRDARDERWRQEDQRRQDATLGLLREQTDMLRRLVELQERLLENRLPLQPLFHPPHVPYPPHPDV